MAGIEVGAPDWVEHHLRLYLESDGREGHLIDFSAKAGGYPNTPTLLLRTIGRKSGRPHIAPLIYGRWKADWAIVGSRGGKSQHSAWYLNLCANPEVRFQAGGDKFAAVARDAMEPERTEIWGYMATLFPTYADYRRATDRVIPVVLLSPSEKVARLEPEVSAR